MALTNIRAFTMGVNKDVEKIDDDRKDETRAVSLYALRNLVFGTRVDTGRARGNYQVAESQPPEGYEPNRFDPTGSVAVLDGSQEILGASGDDIIWIHNGVPYITVLEDWDGMLAGTVEAIKTWIRAR